MSTRYLQNPGDLLPVGEKQKLLQKFIDSVQESEVNEVLTNCEEFPYIPYKLKLSLAAKFQRYDFIVESLNNGDRKILNDAVTEGSIYGSDIDQLSNSEFLISKLFPNVSYICRQKVINKIGRIIQCEETVDEIWNAVKHRYGLYVALPLLQGCTKDKITSVISKQTVVLQGYQLLQILQKYPDVGLQYLRDHYKRNSDREIYSYRKPLLHLFENHPDEFLELLLNYSDQIKCFNFGRRRSTHMIRTYRAKLLEQPEKFSSILRMDRIKRNFSAEEFQIFFESTLHKNPNEIEDIAMWKWIRQMPVDKRLNFIRSAFLKLYQINIDDHPEYMNVEYITLLPDERRLSVVQWKIENDKTCNWVFHEVRVPFWKNEQLKYAWAPIKPISYSIPELEKALLNEKEIKTRAALSRFLICTCYINQDSVQLQNVLTLLSKRSRNDQIEIRNEIFRTIHEIMNYIELTKEHWYNITEMIQVSLVFKDAIYSYETEKEDILKKCLAFHMQSKLPVNTVISMLIKVKILTGSITWTNSHIKNAEDKKVVLELYIKELEKLQSKNNSNSGKEVSLYSSECFVNLIEEICKFNKSQYKKCSALEPIFISSHPWLIIRLKQIAAEKEKCLNEDCNIPSSVGSFAKLLFKIIPVLRSERKLCRNAGIIFEDFFSNILQSFPCHAIFMHFLRSNPSELNRNWPSIFLKMLINESDMRFIGKVKSSNYSTLIDQSIKICLEIINEKANKERSVTVKQKCNAVVVLSILNEPTDFLSLASQFYPVDAKVDVFKENSNEDYEIRQTFAKSLANVTNPHLALPVIEKFCVGDYLKHVVGSLHAQVGLESETKSVEFLLQQLTSTRVSLQKHIIRLFFKICPLGKGNSFLSEINSTNTSIRYEIFLQAIKLCRLLWSEETWTILKPILEKTSIDDERIIQYLQSHPHVEMCPPEFISDYIEACLTLLRKGETEHVSNFISQLELAIDKIPDKTLDGIILYKISEQVTFKSTFCINYLMNSSTASILSHRLSNVWLLVENVIKNSWEFKSQNDIYFSSYPTKMLISDFVKALCGRYLNDSSKAWAETQILHTLLENLRSQFTEKVFKEVLYIELTLLVDIDKKGVEKLRSFGRKLAQFIDSVVKTYGGEIISMVYETTKSFVEDEFKNELNNSIGIVVELIDEILEASQSRHNQMMSLTLLKSVEPKSNSLTVIFEKINVKLSKSDDIVVQSYFNYINR